MAYHTIDFSPVETEQDFTLLLRRELNWDFSATISKDELPNVIHFQNLVFIKERLPKFYQKFIDWAKAYQQSHSDVALLFSNSGMTEKEKMLSGLLYQAGDVELSQERDRARKLFQEFNALGEDQKEERVAIMQELIGSCGDGLYIEPPFYCDYGSNIQLGENVFMNYNCILLDVMPITIGSNVLIAPNVQIYTASHPLLAKPRGELFEYAKPISIGNDVWIGGGAIICPGVSIGNNVVIGAGAVVTRDIESNVFVAGNPARKIRGLE